MAALSIFEIDCYSTFRYSTLRTVERATCEDESDSDQDTFARLCTPWLTPEAIFGLRPAQGLLVDIDENLQRQPRRHLSRAGPARAQRPDPRCDRSGIRPAPPPSLPPDCERSFRAENMDHTPSHARRHGPQSGGNPAPLRLL